MKPSRFSVWGGRIRWFSAEFFVVVAGILFAFAINTWWQDAQTRQREQDFLADLMVDFEENAARLQEAIDLAGEIMSEAQILLHLETAAGGRELGLDSLNYHLQTLSLLPTFQPVTRTYDNIMGAGELQTLSNPELRMMLADFESQLRLVTTVEQTQERQFVSLFLPYIMEHLDYTAVAMFSSETVEIPDPTHAETIFEELGTREFQNWVVLRLTWADDLQGVHMGVLNLVKEINAELKKEGP
ncbi:MAG: hypothetical protein RIE53_09930 [Rhodothermales bacterium]